MAGRMDVAEMEIMKMKCGKKEELSFRRTSANISDRYKTYVAPVLVRLRIYGSLEMLWPRGINEA